ncbi:cell division protein FtsQ/DivIB [Entomobacter blattae]|uniref:Cell division protein FtsQ n=1 Tax=Entomobacter blattae TaxID=2762277 RepID=A0A7H1NNS4_9PROT|nr:cell division protein FtsQ/DivIB [Entomobacter blattae]QNT77434.1 Cell division protein FtsQ [Entomobacter blattae]
MPHLSQHPNHLNDRPSRLTLFMRRQKRMLQPLAILLLLCGLIAGGAYILLSSSEDIPMIALRDKLGNLLPFHVSNISIHGNTLTSDDEILQAANIHKGDSILKISVEGVRKKIDTLPFIDHSVVERHLPGSIIITVIERSPYAVWQHDRHFMLIDRSGKIVADKGMTGKDAQAYMRLPLVVGNDANTAAADLIDTLANFPEIKDRVVAAIRIGERRWNLQLRDGTTIYLPEAEEQAALKRLTDFQNTIKLLDRPVSVIDMRLPDRLIIRQHSSLTFPVLKSVKLAYNG